MHSLQISVALVVVGSVVAFVPHVPPNPLSNNGIGNARQPTTMHWFGGKKKDTVEYIPMNGSSSENGDAKDVYASRMTNDASDDDFIDVKVATQPKKAVVFDEETDFDVIVVGAGCAGIGPALMLTRTFGLDSSRVMMVEKGKNVGDSFRKWPEEMRFISPSFNQQGWTYSFDLNAIHYDTSPAHMLKSEHPSGEEYAVYLEQIVRQADLQVQLETKVTSITDVGKKTSDQPGPFKVETSYETNGETKTMSMTTRYIVWAAGEFQFPKNKAPEEGKGRQSNADDPFPGADLCLHNSLVKSWAELPGDNFVVIGGYESGIDATYNLAQAGKNVRILASTPCWGLTTGDPSSELAPYTAARLREVLSPRFSPNPKLMAPLRVIAVDKAENGGFNVAARWKGVDPEDMRTLNVSGYSGYKVEPLGDEDSIVCFHTDHAPILCNGFEGSVAAEAGHLFDFPDPENKKGCLGSGPLLTRDDESTKVPGVFLVGPSVTHGDLSFCFVYKFRQRFGVVANAICQGLGMETAAAVEECKRTNMYLNDFATCEGTCGDTC